MSDRLSARRVAVIADVHGNAPAFDALIAELRARRPDVVVSCGDLSWGSLPRETLALARELAAETPCVFVRGNAERALLEGGDGSPTERERWMRANHTDDDLELVRSFVETVVVDVHGLGAVRFCHGSPLSDEDCITPATPEERLRPLVVDMKEDVLVSAHTHVQFDRRAAGIRSINPGSVGMPYEDRRGAFWAVFDEGVTLLRTDYDLSETVRRYRATDDPLAEQMVEILEHPPTRAEVIEHAERVLRSG
jgi:putative phosphoesterase